MAQLHRTLCFSLLLLLSAYEVLASDIRRFVAAPKSSHLRRRTLDFEPHHGGHTLLFEDESSTEFAARVHLSPKYPSLVLDDITDHIKDVVCTSSEMTIHFHGSEAMEAAAGSWNTNSELVFYSAHTTCASEGAHEPYLVKYTKLDHALGTVTLAAQKQTLKDCTHRISVDLGRHVANDVQPHAFRRQVTSSTSTRTSSTTTSYNQQTLSLPPTVSFAFATPTERPGVRQATKEIAFAALNKAILPPDETILNLFPGAEPLKSVSMGCKDCSMSGSVTLEAAGFNVSSNLLGEVIDFLDDGFLQFTANKLSSRMLFEVALLPGFQIPLFTANLTRIPLNPIEIPKVITLGPAIELTVPISVVLNSPVNFTTGFELSVPDNAKIIMNVSEISGSSQTGFDKTTFKALPFNSITDNLSLNFTAALRPKLVVSAGVGNTQIGLSVGGGVGAFLDFPKLTASVSSIQNVNATCDGPATQGTTNRAVRVVPNAVFDMGLHWELGVSVANIRQNRGGEQVLLSKTVPLPNQCLVFDSKTSTLVSADSKVSDKNSATSLRFSTIHGCALVFLLTAIGFVSL